MTVFTASEAHRLIISGDAPVGMHVDGSLYLAWTAITKLPEDLSVGGSLYLGGTAITTLPEGLSVGGSLHLGWTTITALPAGLAVGGDLYLGGTAITTLPEGLSVGGGLHLVGTSITTLPAGLSIGGDLGLRGTTVAALPVDLSVGGSLYLGGTAITTLPKGLSVGGGLHLAGTEITTLPEGLTIGGRIHLGLGSKLNFPTAWFAIAGRAGRWRAVGRDGAYARLESDADDSSREARSAGEIGKAIRKSVEQAQPTAKSTDSIGDVELTLLAVQARANIARIRGFFAYQPEDEAAFDRVDTLLAGCIPEHLG